MSNIEYNSRIIKNREFNFPVNLKADKCYVKKEERNPIAIYANNKTNKNSYSENSRSSCYHNSANFYNYNSSSRRSNSYQSSDQQFVTNLLGVGSGCVRGTVISGVSNVPFYLK